MNFERPDYDDITSRTEHLEALLRCGLPVHDIREALMPFGWDSQDELVTLTGNHVRNVIGRFIAGELRCEDVEEWAEAIEGREDIGLETGHEALLLQTIFDLANPAISGKLTPDSAERLLSQLTRPASESGT